MEQKAVLITFSVRSKKFDSLYERNKFYRGLYGWRQIIKSRRTQYKYYKKGLLDNMPYLKIDQSLFMIAKKHLEEIERYFDEWENKIRFNTFEVIINEDKAKILGLI